MASVASTTAVPFFFPSQLLGAAPTDLVAGLVSYDQGSGAVYSINLPGCDDDSDDYACNRYNNLVITEASSRVAYATSDSLQPHGSVICQFPGPDSAVCSYGGVSDGTQVPTQTVFPSFALSLVTVTGGLDQLPSSAMGDIFDNIVYVPISQPALVTGGVVATGGQTATASGSSARATTAGAATGSTTSGAAKTSSAAASSSGSSGASTANAGAPAATAVVSVGGALAALVLAVAAI